MKNISVLIHRMQAGLPLTDDEYDAVRQNIMHERRRNDIFLIVCFSFWFAGSLAILAFKFFGGQG